MSATCSPSATRQVAQPASWTSYSSRNDIRSAERTDADQEAQPKGGQGGKGDPFAAELIPCRRRYLQLTASRSPRATSLSDVLRGGRNQRESRNSTSAPRRECPSVRSSVKAQMRPETPYPLGRFQ